MNEQALSCHQTVNQPYSRVRDALLADPHRAFRQATAAATGHAAALHVRVGGLDISAEVAIDVVGVESDYEERPTTRIALEWRASSSPRVFPAMTATLVLSACSPGATELELRCAYRPIGKLGEVIDASAGHRLIETAVTRFLQQVAGWLRDQLAASVPAPIAEPQPVTPCESTVDLEC